jgi:hypothetical protein
MTVRITGGVTFSGGASVVEQYATVPLIDFNEGLVDYIDSAYSITNGFATVQNNTGNDAVAIDGISNEIFNKFKDLLGDPGTSAHGGYFFTKWAPGSTKTPGGAMELAPSYTALTYVILYWNGDISQYGIYIETINPDNGGNIAGDWLFPGKFALFQQDF